jgi:hypothetical protein
MRMVILSITKIGRKCRIRRICKYYSSNVAVDYEIVSNEKESKPKS